MKTRRILYLAIVAAVLSLAIALPALADEAVIPTDMWIQRNRLAWTGRAYSTSDTVVAKIHIFDATKAMVPGATVTAEWYFNDDLLGEETSVTGSRGIAEFSRPATRGRYMICVTNVELDKWLYDAGQNKDATCSSINVW